MQPVLPVSARLAWWGTAWLRGHAVADLVVDAVLDGDATHVVAGLPGVEGSVSLVSALAELRPTGSDAIGIALPVAGDPVGLGGPVAFNAAALEAGEAAVCGAHRAGAAPGRRRRRVDGVRRAGRGSSPTSARRTGRSGSRCSRRRRDWPTSTSPGGGPRPPTP